MINQAAVPDEPDGRGRRAQIVDAALHVMAEHGFRGASIKRIAQHAGLKSPALIYWYFKDKEALFEAPSSAGSSGSSCPRPPATHRWPRSSPSAVRSSCSTS